jgi:hypothetical protein
LDVRKSWFAYDSFIKSGESIVETQRLFRCRFTRPLNVRFFFLWGYLISRVYEEKPRTLEELKGEISKQIGMINEELLDRVEANFRERLQIFIFQNGYNLGDIIFST